MQIVGYCMCFRVYGLLMLHCLSSQLSDYENVLPNMLSRDLGVGKWGIVGTVSVYTHV